MARKFGGVSGRKEESAAKSYTHLEKTTKQLTKQKASTLTSDSGLLSGSIVYNLTVPGSTPTYMGDENGNNFISFPFNRADRAYTGNGEWADPKCGWWTPTELDKEFNYKIYAIYGEMLQGTVKTNGNGSVANTTGSWVGPLTKLWPYYSYWIKVTGSANVQKTITKQFIPPDVKTHFYQYPGWNARAFPFSVFNNVSGAGFVPAGNSGVFGNLVAAPIATSGYWNPSQGEHVTRLKDYEGESYWSGSQDGGWVPATGTGYSGKPFTFKTGSGFLCYNAENPFGNPPIVNLFNEVAITGSDDGEGNDDTGSDNYYTASSDICIVSGSNYIDTPISNGSFIPGEGGGTFQVYPSTDTYTVYIKANFTGSGGIKSSSILNYDNTQMITPDEWGTWSGSIAAGLYNLSGSNGGASGSTGDNSVCFASALFPSHPYAYTQTSTPYFLLNCQLSDHSGVSGSVDETQYYPTGSNQSSSLKVYSPKCGQVYMARLYQFQNTQPSYSINDITTSIDVTSQLTGSKNEFKLFNQHFIKLRNDVI